VSLANLSGILSSARRATIRQLRRDPWVAADYRPTRASGSRARPALESRALDRMFDPSVAMQSVKQPDDGWGAPLCRGCGLTPMAFAGWAETELVLLRS